MHMNLQEFISHLQSYIALKPPDLGDSDCETVLDQLYQAYTETHESDDPSEIQDGFKELDGLLGSLSLNDNNAVWNLCCQLCTAYERKGFLDGLQYGAHLIFELYT